MTAISPEGIVQQSNITYTLTIAIENAGAALTLHPGMSARVEILVGQLV